MKLHILGTGTPILDPHRPATTAILLEIGAEKLLFDTGRGVTTQLLKQEIDPTTINAVFITHHHYDHICDLGEFLMTVWHNGRVQPVQVIGPPGTAAIVEALFDGVFARDIFFTLFLEPDTVDIHQLVQVREVFPGLVDDTAGRRVYAEYVNHGRSLGLSETGWPCLGYRLEAEGKTITIGGDAVACEGLNRLAIGADVLVMSCYLAEAEITSPGFKRVTDHIIASSGQVGQIAAQAKVGKLVLTHFRRKSTDLMLSLAADVRAAFTGEIYIAADGTSVEV